MNIIDNQQAFQELVWLAYLNAQVCEKIYERRSNRKLNAFLQLSASNAFMEAVSILHTLLNGYGKKGSFREEYVIHGILDDIIEKEVKIARNLDHIPLELVQDFIFLLDTQYPSSKEGFSLLGYFFKENRVDGSMGDFLQDVKSKGLILYGKKLLNHAKRIYKANHFIEIRNNLADHKNKEIRDPALAIKSELNKKMLTSLLEVVKEVRLVAYFGFNYTFDVRSSSYTSVIEDLDEILSKLNN